MPNVSEKKDWVTIDGNHVLIGEEGDGGSGGGSPSGGGRGGGGRGWSSPLEEFRFVNRRLANGGLKPGEQRMLERRAERLARQYYGVPDEGKTMKGVMGEMDCIATCQECIRMCMDCISMMEKCPNKDATHEACITKCRECIGACEMCISDLKGNADMATCQATCRKCAEMCMECVETAEAVAMSCDDCKSMCEMCSESCAHCAEMCQKQAGDMPDMEMKHIKIGARNSRSDQERLQMIHDFAKENGASCEKPEDEMPMEGKSIEEEVIFPGDEIKAAKMKDGAIKLGGYLVRFGNANNTDLTGDYFTKNTDFGKAKESDVWFNHRLPIQVKKHKIEVKYTEPLSNKAVLTVDDAGIFAEVVLEARNEYEKTIAELGLAGKLAWSSGTASHLVDRKAIKEGVWEITRWRLGLDASLTPTPAEFRKTNRILPIKSLLTSKDTALPVEEDKQTQPIIQPNNQRETKTMNELNESAVAEIAAKAVAAALAEREAKSQAEAQKAAELKAAEDAGYKKAIEDLKNNPGKTFYHSTEPVNDDNDGVQAFKSWMGTGQVNGGLIRPTAEFLKAGGSYYIGSEGKAAWNVNDGATGGFLVPDPLYQQIIAKRDIGSWVRQFPVQHFQTPADHLLVPRENTKMTDFVLTAEAGSYNEDEGTVTQKDLILYKYTKLTKVSEEFLLYNNTNWESWFSNALGRSVALTENTIYTTGTGTSQPEGIVTGATVANTTATTDVILPSELSALIGYLGGGYNVAAECGFLMSNTTKWYLKGTGGTAAVPFAYVQTPQDGDFFGYKAVVDDDLEPYTTASAKCVIFGNYTYFAAVEKPGIIVQRNPYLYQATGQIGIFASMFRGGGVLQSEAFYYLTNKAS